MKPSPKTRTVWVWADSHFGCIADGVDGADWAERSARELLQNVGRPDYAVVLGDITHAGTEEQFRRYDRLRRESGIAHWFEIVGNHDYRGVRNGLYRKYVRRERHYVVVDGNVCWVFVSAEKSNARGFVRESTRRWLEEVLARYRDRNIILCTHQLVANTVRRTEPVEKSYLVLAPVDWLAGLRRRRRIDLWLGAHEHGPPRTPDQFLRCGRTVFVNVASLSHIYGTRACNSFWLEMREGRREIVCRCRDHDRERFIPRLGGRVPLPFPIQLSAAPEVMERHRTMRPHGRLAALHMV